jgi:hypothetical protein
MQSTGAKRASSPPPGAKTEPQGAAPSTGAGAAPPPQDKPPQQEKRPRPQPVWPGPYRKERSRANPLTIMLSIAALLLAVGGLYWISSLQEDLARQRGSILTLQQQNRKLADQAEETATDARAATEALMERQAVKQPAQTTPPPPRQAAASTDAPAPQTGGTGQPYKPTFTPPSALPSSRPNRQVPTTDEQPVVHIYPPATSPAGTGSSAVQAPSGHSEPSATTPQPRLVAQAHTASTPAAPTQPPGSQVASSSVKTGLFGSPVPTDPRDPRSTSTRAASPAYSSGARNVPVNTEPMEIARPAPVRNSNALAENIARVAELQRHTSVQLREFHVAVGRTAKPFPDTSIEATKLDPKHGTFRLMVVGSDSRSQQKGTVFEPLPVVDQTTGRHYRLTITNIQSNEMFGYLSEAR